LCTISLTLALEDELMEIEGKVVFTRKSMDGQVETGIRFLDSGEKKVRLLRQFITNRARRLESCCMNPLS